MYNIRRVIGVNILEEYPEYFDAAVLSAPILEINTGSVENILDFYKKI